MKLIDLKTELQKHRKQANIDFVNILQVVISETENELKKPSSKGKTESQIIVSIIKATVKNLLTTLKLTSRNSEKNNIELNYLESLLPKPLTDKELEDFIKTIPSGLSFGEAMKWIKSNPLFERIDMSTLTKLLKAND